MTNEGKFPARVNDAAVYPRVDVLGAGISCIDMNDAHYAIREWIKKRQQRYVCVTNVHSVMESLRNPKLRDILNRSGLSTPDGMPLVWLCRWGGQRRTQRVYGPDLMMSVCESGQAEGYRHFLYGGEPNVLDLLAKRLEREFPSIDVAGSFSPPFRTLTEDEDKEIVDMINKFRPDVVWVGLGAPKQELWMADHIDRLNCPVLVGVGAAFDFIAGQKSQAPAWMRNNGLEWLFRLIQEPRRLWRRYVILNPLFILSLALHRAGIAHVSPGRSGLRLGLHPRT